MINTYQTSMAPPPVPPRMNRCSPYLVPASVLGPPNGYSRVVMRFLAGVVLLHILLSCGAFTYLFLDLGKMTNTASSSSEAERLSDVDAEGKVSAIKAERTPSPKAMARMTVTKKSGMPGPGILRWNMHQSFYRDIYYHSDGWLTVQQPGDYYVYSRVTFSRSSSSAEPLTSRVKLRKSKDDKDEQDLTMAYCSIGVHSSPQPCTIMQSEVLTLETGNQLSVWVLNRLLVSYEVGATSFGIHKL